MPSNNFQPLSKALQSNQRHESTYQENGTYTGFKQIRWYDDGGDNDDDHDVI